MTKSKELEILIEAHKVAFDRAMVTQSDPYNDHEFVAQDWDAECVAALAVDDKAAELGVELKGWHPVEVVPEPQVHPVNGRLTGATRRQL